MSDYRAGAAYVSVVPDMSGFTSGIREELDALDAEFAEAGASAGAAYSDAFAAAAHLEVPDAGAAAAAGPQTAEVTAVADTAGARTDLDELTEPRTDEITAVADAAAAKADLDEAALPREAEIGVDDDDAEAKIDALQLQVDILTAAKKGIVITADMTDAEVKIAALEAELEELQVPKKVEISESGGEGISPMVTGIVAALVLLGPAAAGAAAGLGLVGAAVGAAAMSTGGLSDVTANLEHSLQNGMMSVSGFGAALDSVGSKSMGDFESAAGSVGQALGQLFVTFSPEIEEAAGYVEDIAADFDKWAQSVSSSGLDDFLSKAFSPQELSDLKEDFGDIVKIVGTLGQVEQAIQPFAMNGLTDILNALSKLDPTKVEMLLALFAALKAAQMVSSLGSSITGMVNDLGYVLNGPSAGEAAAAGTQTGAAYAEGVEGRSEERRVGKECRP